MLTLIVSAFMIVWLNPSVVGVGAFALGKSGEPLLDGFRAIYGGGAAKILAFVAVIGLIASFHTIIYAKGRQIYSLSRAGYFPSALSVTHGSYKTPHVAMIVGALVALAVMFVVWFGVGRRRAAPSSAARCSTWRCSARCSPTSCRRSPSSCCGGTCRISSGPTAARSAFPAPCVTIIIGW